MAQSTHLYNFSAPVARFVSALTVGIDVLSFHCQSQQTLFPARLFLSRASAPGATFPPMDHKLI